jgi:AraC-like DNA-binding protein
VESNICNPVTAEELAFLCNTSLSTFKRNFRKIYSSSPQKWLLQRKLAIAADLLKHPDQRPGGIYEKVGYENHSSFTQAFKKQYGLTPSAYQEQNLTLQP